jgi:hypothetical protein
MTLDQSTAKAVITGLKQSSLFAKLMTPGVSGGAAAARPPKFEPTKILLASERKA